MISEGDSLMAMKWYVVHTYSGHENKARLSLMDRVRQASLNEKFGEVLIPTDTVVEHGDLGRQLRQGHQLVPGGALDPDGQSAAGVDLGGGGGRGGSGGCPRGGCGGRSQRGPSSA